MGYAKVQRHVSQGTGTLEKKREQRKSKNKGSGPITGRGGEGKKGDLGPIRPAAEWKRKLRKRSKVL